MFNITIVFLKKKGKEKEEEEEEESLCITSKFLDIKYSNVIKIQDCFSPKDE